MSEAAIEELMRGALPIEHGARSVRLGSARPVVTADGIAVDVGGVEARVAPYARLAEGAEAVVAAWLAALRVVVEEGDGPATGRLSCAALDVRMPLDLVPGATVDALTGVMLKPQWLGALAAPARRTPYAYELAPPSVAYTSDGSLDADAIEGWWERQLWDDVEVPAPARLLGELRRFCAMTANGGLGSVLLQRSGDEIIRVYRDLVEIGARKLAGRLAAGIPAARRGHAELMYEGFAAGAGVQPAGAKTWPAEMRAVAPVANLDELDGHAYPGSWYLIARELGPARNRFVRRHRAALVRA